MSQSKCSCDSFERLEGASVPAYIAAFLDQTRGADPAEKNRYRCRVCGRRCDPNAADLVRHGHRHHITYRSAGGQDVSSNLVLLCNECHADEHAHRLKVEGDGDTGIEVWRLNDDGGWFLVRREVAVGQTERD